MTSSVGPGQYDVSRSDAITRQKSPNINMGSSPARRSTNARDGVDVAPGQYDDGIRFNSNSKSYTIGEKRTEKMKVTDVGPGQYSPEKADCLTKTRITQVNLATSSTRHDHTIHDSNVNVAPGQY